MPIGGIHVQVGFDTTGSVSSDDDSQYAREEAERAERRRQAKEARRRAKEERRKKRRREIEQQKKRAKNPSKLLKILSLGHSMLPSLGSLCKRKYRQPQGLAVPNEESEFL